MSGHVLGKRDGEVKAQREIAVALGKAIDLLFGLAAALGEQDLGGFYKRRIQRGKTVERIALPEDIRYLLHLHLLLREELHEA